MSTTSSIDEMDSLLDIIEYQHQCAMAIVAKLYQQHHKGVSTMSSTVIAVDLAKDVFKVSIATHRKDPGAFAIEQNSVP